MKRIKQAINNQTSIYENHQMFYASINAAVLKTHKQPPNHPQAHPNNLVSADKLHILEQGTY